MISTLGKVRKKLKRYFFPNKQEGPVEMRVELENMILVGTHHKMGTAWMSGIFREICRKFGLVYFTGEQEELPGSVDVFLQNHSKFDLTKLQMEYKGLHLIRDPRDAIISGCFYHQKSGEPWLHVRQERLGGLTYQEKINSYSSLDDQIMFEMEYAREISIGEILSWDYANLAFIEVKYEDLISDTDLILFHKIFTFLGFPGQSIPGILRIAYENSLFSGNLKMSRHIRSGRTRQWETHFKPRHKARFLELFGDALIRLGYEDNNDWANR